MSSWHCADLNSRRDLRRRQRHVNRVRPKYEHAALADVLGADRQHSGAAYEFGHRRTGVRPQASVEARVDIGLILGAGLAASKAQRHSAGGNHSLHVVPPRDARFGRFISSTLPGFFGSQ